MQSCREFFEENKEGKKCKFLMEKSEAELIAWEKECAAEWSPGIVDDSEMLYHQILNPVNLTPEKDGLGPLSFDTVTGIGMSTNRCNHATLDEMIALGRLRAKVHNDDHPDNPKPRSLWGFVPIPVALIRSIVSRITDTRALFVYDTALEHDISHADICQGTKDQKKGLRSARFELYEMVKGRAFAIDPELG